jgi:osmotically-inducible protein OsmY
MSDDQSLQQRIIEELDFDPAINAAQIGVSVDEGVVTLSGHVQSFMEKHAAERAARRVKGVRAVAQEIEVRLASDRKTADDEIATRALKILDWDLAVPSETIAVKVEHGAVTLSGDVDWAYQRAEAEHDVRKLGGVKSVINEIRIRPKTQPEDVRAKIRAAFERSAELEASRITIEISDGKVRLGGKVNTWVEREEAERAAWSAPGVVAVDDQIMISRP